ncbi:hypothetical protein MTO96_046425 [Rhipicephalus appendiculatus]
MWTDRIAALGYKVADFNDDGDPNSIELLIGCGAETSTGTTLYLTTSRLPGESGLTDSNIYMMFKYPGITGHKRTEG